MGNHWHIIAGSGGRLDGYLCSHYAQRCISGMCERTESVCVTVLFACVC